MKLTPGGAIFVGTTVLIALMDGGLSAAITQVILGGVLAVGTRIALNKADQDKSMGKNKQ